MSSLKNRQLEDIIRELRSLAGNRTRNATKKAKNLMVQLKRMGYTNVDISELSGGGWGTSTVKSHTRGVTTNNPGPKNRATELLTELVDLNLTLDNVKETNKVAKSLRDKGLKLEDLLNFYKELQKHKIDLKDLLNTYDELQKTGIKIDKIKEILNYKTDLDKLGINQESLHEIHEASKKFGKPTEILEALNAYGELKNLNKKLDTLNNELETKQKKLDALKNNIAELEEEEKKIQESLEIYRKLEAQGYSTEVLAQIEAISKKYEGPKEFLKGLQTFENLTMLENKLSQLTTEKNTVENDLKNKIEKLSIKETGLESSISELERRKESLRTQVNELTETAGNTLKSISNQFTTETEKMTNKLNGAVINLSSKIDVFQKNLAKAYGDSLKEIRETIPETTRVIGEIDAKIERSKNLSLIIDLMEKPIEIKEPVITVFRSMIALTQGMETFTEIHKDKIKKSSFIKGHLIGLRSDLLEFIQDELGKTTTGNER